MIDIANKSDSSAVLDIQNSSGNTITVSCMNNDYVLEPDEIAEITIPAGETAFTFDGESEEEEEESEE